VTTKTFHIADILTITTGRLVSPSHIGGVYDILNWMTGDNLFTHQLPRACDECAEPLRAQFPDLADVEVPDDFGGDEGVRDWVEQQVAAYGKTREVAPLAAAEHTHINPLTEMRKVAPHAKIIAIEVPPVNLNGPEAGR
jgi:hypothetical protein